MTEPVVGFLDNPPGAGQRVNELWCWVAIQEDGGEGIIAGLVPGLGATPLVSSKRDVAAGMATLARQAQRASMHRADRVVRIELRGFRRTGIGGDPSDSSAARE